MTRIIALASFVSLPALVAGMTAAQAQDFKCSDAGPCQCWQAVMPAREDVAITCINLQTATRTFFTAAKGHGLDNGAIGTDAADK